MANIGIGVYRKHGSRGYPATVHVTDGVIAADIPEHRYRSAGYRPVFEQLPWFDIASDPAYFREPPARATPRSAHTMHRLVAAGLFLMAISGLLPLG